MAHYRSTIKSNKVQYNNMKKIFILLVIFNFFQLSAQEVSQNRVWNLYECMSYAIENSPKSRIQSLKNRSSQIDQREAVLNFLPSLSASSGASASFGRSIDPNTNIYTNNTAFNNNYSISAQLAVFDGFGIVDNLRINKIAMLNGMEQSKLIENEICLNVIQAYYNVIFRKEMVDITSEQLNESMKNLHRTKTQEEMGLKSQADVLQMEADVASKDYMHTCELNNFEQAVLSLKEFMFFPSDQHLEIESIDVSVNPFDINHNPSSIARDALAFLPQVKIAENNLKSSQYYLHNAKWSLLPSLYLYGGINSGYVNYFSDSNPADKFFDQLKNKRGEYLQLSISIPIFNSLSRQNRIAKRKNDVQVSQIEHQRTLKEVEIEIERAVQDMQGAAKEFIQSQKRDEAIEVAHKANTRKFEEGLISVLDLQNSSNQLLQAQADRVNKALAYLLKSRIVNYYKGTPYLLQE